MAAKKYDESSVKKLRGIEPVQRNSAAVGDLVKIYGSLPDKKSTVVTTPGLDKAIDELIQGYAIQQGIANGWTQDRIAAQVRILKSTIMGGLAVGPGGVAVTKADGGLIPGWSPHSKADNIPAWLTAREFVQPVSSVDYYGVGAMEALRRRQIPRDVIRGYATGGLVTKVPQEWPINMPVTAKMPISIDELWAQWRAAQVVTGSSGYNNDVSRTAYKTAQSLGAAAKVILSMMEAGIVESGMRNLNYGDRDSVGFLQQRPSQGWPDPMNVATAARSYLLRAMPKDKLYPKFTAGRLAQSVQVSAFPERYDQVEPAARTLIGVLSGQGVASLVGNASPGFPPWPASPGAQRGDSGVWHNVIAVIKSGPASGSFGNAYRPGDPLWHGSGRAVDWMGFEQDPLATYLAGKGPLELIHRTNARDYAYTRGRNKGSFSAGLMQAHRNHIHIAFGDGGPVPDLGPSLAQALNIPHLIRDQGGWIPPGLSVVNNSTGKDEWMFSDAQLKELVGAKSGGGQSGPLVHIDTLNAQESTPHGLAAELLWEMKTR